MVVSSKTLDSIKTIGLNKYERNLWVALLSRGASTAGELSDISNVPRSRRYDVLESLADRGFVILQPGKPMKYLAVNPKEALERAKKKIQEEAVEMSDKIDRLSKSDAVKELEKIHKDNIKTVRPEDVTGALKGRYAMLQQFETMFKKAKKNIRLVMTEVAMQELLENHASLLKKAADAGVKIQIAMPVTKQNGEIVKDLMKYAQVRDVSEVEHIEKMLGRFCSVDGQEFIMGLTDDKTHPTQDVAFWTQSTHAASQVFEPMFDLVWQHAKPVKA
ncbi:MAG: helix-turn-helix domain-containing protein [Candidatus Aenigmarchaeota archaeon]|nr:helix-turn-helix domain-containing protein [Candidatus Aenigmarchaeota archaeon]MDI6721935.1 helix-turn-helix domain-containing protein [Candidatus Aenigmarchaeota archaeon]